MSEKPRVPALAEWMARAGIEDPELARAIRKTRATASRLRRGKMMPSLRLAGIIQAISAGAVPVAVWLPPAPKWAKPLRRAA